MTEMKCSFCLKADPTIAVLCKICGAPHHMECIPPETRPTLGPNGEVGDWHCSMCLLTGADPSNEQILAVLYSALATKNRPVAVYLGHMFKKMMALEKEVADLRALLHTKHLHDDDMNGHPAGGLNPQKPRKVILFGKDIKKLEEPVKQRLPKNAPFQAISSSTSTDDELFFSEVKKVIEETKETSEVLVCYHPSADDCLRLEGKKILSSLSSLSSWLTENGHTSVRLAVASVPQLVPEECQRINEQLQKVAAEGHIEYIPLTRIQSTMLLEHSVVYSAPTADKIADVLSRSITSFLGVKRVRTPKPKKEDPARNKQAAKPSKSSPKTQSSVRTSKTHPAEPASSSRELQGLKSQLDVVLKCLQNLSPKRGQKRGGGRGRK